MPDLPIRCDNCGTVTVLRPCEHCGRTFTAHGPRHRYCSTRCRVAAHRERRT